MKPQVLVQIALLEGGKIAVTSTSTNQITNLGLIGVAQSMFLKGIEEKEAPKIIQPELVP